MSCVDYKKYTSYMDRLIRITHAEPFDQESYIDIISAICKDYRLAKALPNSTTPR